jgi:hypothetical protein
MPVKTNDRAPQRQRAERQVTAMLKDALEAGRRAIEGNLPGARMGLGELPSTEESQRAGK